MDEPKLDKNKKYYAKLRNDPVRWAKHLAADKVRKERAKQKDSLDPERLKHAAEMARARQERFKAKRAAELLGLPIPVIDDTEKHKKKIECNRQYRERNREKMNAQQRAKYLATRAVEKRVLQTPEERAEKRRLCTLKYTAIRNEKLRLERALNPPATKHRRVTLNDTARHFELVNNYAVSSRLMSITEAAGYLDISPSELIMAGLKGEAPRPSGMIHGGVIAYAIEAIREYKNNQKGQDK